MTAGVYDLIWELNFFEYHQILLNSDYFELIFPFLLAFAIFYTALTKIKIFQSKKTGAPLKPIIFIISLVISIYGVTFETSAGYNVGSLLMMMFPNISAITMGALSLYIIGALMGKNFFFGMFRKDIDTFASYAVGAVGLGAVIFYTGIAMGFWNFNPLSQQSYWNVILAVAFLILGIVFTVIGSFPLGFVFLFVFLSFVFGGGSHGSILDYFIDPFVFIILIIGLLLNWLGSDLDSRATLAKTIREQEDLLGDYEKGNGVSKLKPYKSKIYDVVDVGLDDNKKRWEKLFPNDKGGWRK